MRLLTVLALLAALAVAASAQATHMPQPRLGVWEHGSGEFYTLRSVGGAYEMRYAADLVVQNLQDPSGGKRCTLRKGTLAFRLRELPNRTDWSEESTGFADATSCKLVPVTREWNSAYVLKAGKSLLGGWNWVRASSTPAPHRAGRNVVFAAVLDVSEAVPRPTGTKRGAGGLFSATLVGTTLEWTLTMSGLTARATAAHIHQGAKGKKRWRARGALRPMHIAVAGNREVDGGRDQVAGEGRDVRQRSHREEQKRRDPRADRPRVLATC